MAVDVTGTVEHIEKPQPDVRRSNPAATQRERAKLRKGLLFISPWIVGFLAFVVYPIFYSFGISLTRYSGMLTPEWVGFSNYARIFVDPIALKATGNTLFYTGLAVPVGLVVAVLLALAMNRNVREVGLYRTALYLPTLVPLFAMSFIFIVFVNPQYGLLNQFLGLFGGGDTNLLGDPTDAKIVIVAMAQLGAGSAALIFLAGLNNIPKSLYEAARVDGAGPMRSFFTITLPLLTPAILFNFITAVSAGLQVFTQGFVLTNGGPNNGTLFYMHYLYKNAFQFFQMGYASALAWILLVMILILTALVFRGSAFWVFYESARPTKENRVRNR